MKNNTETKLAKLGKELVKDFYNKDGKEILAKIWASGFAPKLYQYDICRHTLQYTVGGHNERLKIYMHSKDLQHTVTCLLNVEYER
jgi:hypothetical protein